MVIISMLTTYFEMLHGGERYNHANILLLWSVHMTSGRRRFTKHVQVLIVAIKLLTLLNTGLVPWRSANDFGISTYTLFPHYHEWCVNCSFFNAGIIEFVSGLAQYLFTCTIHIAFLCCHATNTLLQPPTCYK